MTTSEKFRKVVSDMMKEGATSDQVLQMILEVAENTGKSSDKVTEKVTAEPVNMQIVITEIMKEIGVPAHIKGYSYVREAILYCLNNKKVEGVTKELYPAIATKFNTTPSRIERAIRHAVEVAWDRGSAEVFEKYFGYSVNGKKGNPTNSEFIFTVVDWINVNVLNQ